MQLKCIPEQRRTAREHILILAYEKYQRDREEIQELRMSRDNSRSVLLKLSHSMCQVVCFMHDEKESDCFVPSFFWGWSRRICRARANGSGCSEWLSSCL